MIGVDYFSKSYEQARYRFIAAACAAGAQMDELHLDVKGPNGVPLAIEIAWLGIENPSRVVIHSSGIHGVEGFAGSAVQLALLESGLDVPADAALVLVHCLNPYGMAWLRRANEHNVDINRNFILDETTRTGAAATYRELDGLLNPAHLPPGPDLFYLHALRAILKHGLPALKQAVAEGQYDFPKGLFFGGNEFEKGPLLYLAWLSLHLKSVQRVFAIDVHTGLGKWGQEALYFRSGANQDEGAARLAERLGKPVVTDAAANGAYEIRGMLSEVFSMLEPRPEWSFVLQEFGTYPVLKVLNALRKENYWYHHDTRDIGHGSRQHLKEMLTPANRKWRSSVVERGVSLCQQVMEAAFA